MKDLLDGLVMAIGSPVLALIAQSALAGGLVFNLPVLLTTAVAAAGTFLLHRFFTPAATVITGTPTPGTSSSTVVIPHAAAAPSVPVPTISETAKP